MSDSKLTEDRKIHAAIRAMFRLVYERLTDRELDELDRMVVRINDMAGIKLEMCKHCDSDFVEGTVCDYCTATRS